MGPDLGPGLGSHASVDGGADGGHVDGLLAEVGARVGGAGYVGCKDCEIVCGIFFHEPDMAGAEHGVCCCEEGEAEGGEGGERGVYCSEKGFGWRCGSGGCGEGAEEEVVVVGHGGVVEERGFRGIPSVFDS